MNNTLIFFCIASCLLAFSIIVVNTSISDSDWKDLNCKRYSDFHDYTKEKGAAATKDEYLKLSKEGRNLCNRRKAMYGLGISSIVCDIVLGFFCAFLSFLHYLGVGKVYEKVTGIIGLVSGIICFILTLVYVIYSGYIFTNDNVGMDITFTNTGGISKDYGSVLKLDKDGVFAKFDTSDNTFKCVYYDKDDESKLFAKNNDLGKKRYNYNKDSIDPNSKFYKCKASSAIDSGSISSSSTIYSICKNGINRATGSDCDVAYIDHNDFDNKYQYDKWITSIIFDTLNIALSIGLAIFGFLLFKGSSDGHTPL